MLEASFAGAQEGMWSSMVRPTLSVVPARVVPARAQIEADWTLRAVCATTAPDDLFVTGAAQRDATKICQACPVRLECLADALDNQIEYGVWGGMTERQRRAVLKKSPEVLSWRSVLEESRASRTQDAAS